MSDVFEIIKKRRSTRKFNDRKVAREDAEKILAAGQFAPSGGNNQSCHFIVLSNREKMLEMVALAKEEFAKMEIYDGMYKSLANTIRNSVKSEYDFTYGSSMVILVANRRNYGNAMADSALATENMLLEATELDIKSCYINQIHWLTENSRMREMLSGLGLGEDEDVFCSLVLGYSDNEITVPLKRFGNRITYID